MTTYTPTRVTHQTLTANTADAVNLQAEYGSVEIVNWDTTNKIYFRIDGVTPVIGAAENFVVGPGQSLTIPTPAGWPPDGIDALQLISAGACTYTVTGIP